MDKFEQDILKNLATKYDFVPGRLKDVGEFLKTMQDFAHYLSTSQYFSESLNKKVAMLTLDIDSLALRVEVLRLMEDMIYAEAEKSALRKEIIKLEKGKVDKLKREVAEIEKVLLETSESALSLTKEIRSEFKAKHGVG